MEAGRGRYRHQSADPAAERLAAEPVAHAQRAKPEHAALLRLQRTAGNRAVTALLREQPGFAAPDVTALIPSGGGSPLADRDRAAFEVALGRPLGHARVHSGPSADAAARALGAEAFTIGSHMYFAEGALAPGTTDGDRRLAHELIHVLQHDDGLIQAAGLRSGHVSVSSPTDSLELAAYAGEEAMSRGAAAARQAAVPSAAASPVSAPSPMPVSLPKAGSVVHRDAAPAPTATSPASRLAAIDRQLNSMVITEDHRARLMAERQALTGGNPPGAQAIDVFSLSPEEYLALTGQPADRLPEGDLPGLGQEALSPAISGGPATFGAGSLFTPPMNWYYRVLSPTDPTISRILGGADLLPRAPDPGFVFQPAGSRAEMTFRHLRPGGNVPQVGTDRISTAQDLDAFGNVLANRGTGELVRIDADAARRLGAQFLERGDVLGDLDKIGADITRHLEAARAAGRGRNAIAKLESRLAALERAREYARTFGEGQGVGSVPSASVTEVTGASLSRAVAGERAFLSGVKVFRYGGRVLLVVGIGASIARVASAPEGQGARVATQEAGGWALSLPAAAGGAKVGALAGAALGWETGPGAVVAVILGSLIGGALGFFGGQAAADRLYDAVEGSNWLDQASQREYEHFKALNPDATPADYNRLQDAQESFDTWGIP
jgi:hypothetical protein